MKSQILKLRKQIYEYFKNKALELESRSVELDAYLYDQNEMAKRKFKVVDIERIQNRIIDANVVYLGDFHTFDQNIRNVLRIIKYLIANNKTCILGLEMIRYDFQIYIDTYLENHITDLEFLDSIRYHDSWRFPWTHYKVIFELAKKHGIKVIGLNTDGSLAERDQFAAQIIHDIHQQHPDTPQIILYGELHISPNKIPGLVQLQKPSINQTIIHQNLDEVYWNLVQENLEQGIVEFNRSEFCLISAPPWIKYESMIYWYENLCDDPDFDIHEYIIENGKKTFSEDTSDQFHSICVELNSNLSLQIEASDLENFNLFDHTGLEFIENKLESSLEQKTLDFFQYLIATGKSFKIPHQNILYCSSYSMNRISYLAGIHLLYQKKPFEESTENEAFFILKSYESLFAFFFSKIINPHRKCDMFQDLLMQEAATQNISEKQYLKLCLDILRNQRLPELESFSYSILFEASACLGHIIGEYLYQSFALPMNQQDINELIESLEINQDFFNDQVLSKLLHLNFQNHRKRTF
ncbi:MAG: hypothetical protein CME62_18080 [Halobacteriovoraceae bacterium]|nr:hypothetical protein [Halobacteriovoraceae bacterium]